MTNYAFDTLLQCRNKVLSSRSDLFGDAISIFHQVYPHASNHYIGIKYFGSGNRFTKWKPECWIEEPNTNKETKINGLYWNTGTTAVNFDISGNWGVLMSSSVAISQSTMK